MRSIPDSVQRVKLTTFPEVNRFNALRAHPPGERISTLEAASCMFDVRAMHVAYRESVLDVAYRERSIDIRNCTPNKWCPNRCLVIWIS